MRRTLTPYVLAAAALILALILLVLGTPPPSQNDDPSSRVAGKAGTLALYRWLGVLGFQVHRISGRFDTSGSDTILVIDPRSPVSAADAAAMMRSLAHGADLLLAVSPQSQVEAGALLRRLHVRLSGARSAGTSVPAQPIDAGNRVHHVPMGAGSSIEPSPRLTPLLTQSGSLVAVAEQVGGAGRAYVLASPFPLSNDGLRDADSSTLVISLLERARGGSIGFDEFHHGEANAGSDGAAAVFESPLGLALLLAVVALVLFLALSGRRLGRPLPGGDPALVPTTASYIDAMAGLYARSRDRGAVASRYAEELKHRLSGGLAGDPGPAGDPAFLATVQASRPDLAGEVTLLLQRARGLAAATPDAAALLALARDVDDLERRWAQPLVAATAQWRE
ncbi:MAG: DUF4350 domain-containing protein [Candidatus Dormibacteria bacterium]